MSFCPSNDIHSIYLDDELPRNYKAEYEKHIAECSDCRKKLEQLRRVSNLLRKNSSDLQPVGNYLDESFNRLQIKMTYRKNAEKSVKKTKIDFKYAFGAVAAVALFAIFIPVRAANLQKNQNSNSYFINSLMASAIPANSISQSALNGGFSASVAKNVNSGNNVAFDSGKSVLISGNIHETAFSSSDSKSKSRSFAQNIGNSDVLRPEFEENAISIRITIPVVGQLPVTTEISLPLSAKSGKVQ